MTLHPQPFAFLVDASLILACQTKGPAPGQELATEPADVTMAERERAPAGAEATGIPSDKYKRGYATHDPHGPAGHLNAPPSHVSGEFDAVDLGGLKFKSPEGWLHQHPASAMRRAELGIEDDKGTAGLDVTQIEVAGTYFGGMGAGTPEGGKPGQRMIASIVETSSGPFYFKFLGDDAVVSSNREAFEGLLASMKASK